MGVERVSSPVRRGFSVFMVLAQIAGTASWPTAGARASMVSDSIPDEIDYQKYYEIFRVAKEQSDSSRATAENRRAQAAAIDQSIATKVDQVNRGRDRIAQNLQTIDQLSRLIPQLQRENSDLTGQVNNHQIDLQVNQRSLQDVYANMRALDVQIEHEGRNLDVLQRELDGINIQLRRDLKDLRDREARLRDHQTAAAQLQRDLAVKTQQRAQLVQELQQYNAQLPQVQQQLAQAQQQQAGLQQTVNQLSQQIAQKNAEVAAAQQRVNRAQAVIAPIQNEINAARTRVTQLQQQLQAANTQIGQLQPRVAQLQQSIAISERRVQEGTAEIARLQQENTGLRGQAQQVDAQIAQVQPQVQQTQSKLQVLDRQIQQLLLKKGQLEKQPPSPERDKQIAALVAQINSMQSQRAPIAAQLQQLRQQLQALQAQKAPIQQKLDANNARIGQLQPEIARLQQAAAKDRADLTAVQGALGKAAASRDQANQQLPAAQQALAAAEAKLPPAQQELANAQAALAAANNGLAPLQQRLAAAQTQLNQVSAQVTQLANQANSLRAAINQHTQTITQLDAALQQGNQRLVALNREIQVLGGEVDQLRRRTADLERQRQNCEARYNIQAQRFSDLQSRRNSYAVQADSLEREIRRLSDLIDTKVARINQNNYTIDQSDRQLRAAQAENVTLQDEIARLEPEIERLRADSTWAWDLFLRADAEAKALEADTSQKLAKYQQVKALYDSRIAAAREKGRQQGVVAGRTEAEKRGRADGEAAGKSEGEPVGRQQGLQYGFDQGKALGESEGKDQGYRAGLASKDAYELGIANGKRQGEADARAEAARVNYPLGRQDKQKELTSRLPDRLIELDNNATPLQGMLNRSRTPSRVGSELGILSLDDRANGARGFRVEASGQLDRLADGEEAGGRELATFFVEDVASLEAVDCATGYGEFDRACLQSYQDAYNATYQSVYGPVFRDAKAAAYESARRAAFEANKEVRKKEGYDFAFPTAYSKWKEVGAREIENKGFIEGKAQGYASTIDRARAEEFARGQADESAYFQTNAFIRLVSGEIVKVAGNGSDGFEAGDRIALKIRASNFGRKDSTRGQLKIKWEALTPNVVVENGVKNVIGIPGDTQADVTNVVLGKIADDATGDEPASIKVTAYLPDGQMQEMVVTVQLKLFIAARVQKDMSLRPMIFTVGPKRELFPVTHKVTLKVMNPTQIDARKPFRVTMTMPAIEGLTVLAGDATTALIRAGGSQDVTFKYRTSSRGLAERQVPVQITVYYGDRISHQETVTIVPFMPAI